LCPLWISFLLFDLLISLGLRDILIGRRHFQYSRVDKTRIERHSLQKASASQFSLLRLKTTHNLKR